ncbi:hypothetical protein EJ08DRAFT_663500 [Tothia fuscella]|uniref:Uncharacterized protein n=1 Tax=Tothia fuscella TaxID=1048955 RepID=A0A9P4NKT3_9PEZI|nr:hypothetical protein EJ08DRAFT_663500 [Tothia fuscella]
MPASTSTMLIEAQQRRDIKAGEQAIIDVQTVVEQLRTINLQDEMHIPKTPTSIQEIADVTNKINNSSRDMSDLSSISSTNHNGSIVGNPTSIDSFSRHSKNLPTEPRDRFLRNTSRYKDIFDQQEAAQKLHDKSSRRLARKRRPASVRHYSQYTSIETKSHMKQAFKKGERSRGTQEWELELAERILEGYGGDAEVASREAFE